MRRALLVILGLLVVAYAAFGLSVWSGRAPRVSALDGAPLDLRGAYHVHTTASDGRASLAEVIAAAKDEGLGFVVVTDHNRRVPDAPEYVDGVLVVPGTEASTRYGHVVALGVPRPLTKDERAGDPLGAIRALGGEAILAHPFHPRRPFTGWGTGPWRGFEVVSNDTAWGRVVATRDVGRAAVAALELPFDGPRAVLTLGDDPSDELARFDAEAAAARSAGERRPAARVLLCSHDAHGYPSYRAAFGAFSMHVPVAPTGDARADAAAVTAALLDGRAVCVFDAVAPAARTGLSAREGALALTLEGAGPAAERATWSALRNGVPVPVSARQEPGGVRLACGDRRCPPGDWRVEGRLDGRAWIFTNPVRIE